MSSLDMPIGDTLALVNVVRNAFGYNELYELPDATRGATTDCLFYRALKDCGATSVGSHEIAFSSERQAAVVAELWGTSARGKQVQSPRSVTHVIHNFDNGHTPQYNT